MDYVNVANEIYFLTRLAKPSKGHVITKEESKLKRSTLIDNPIDALNYFVIFLKLASFYCYTIAFLSSTSKFVANNPFRIYNLLVSNFVFTFVSKYIENVSNIQTSHN